MLRSAYVNLLPSQSSCTALYVSTSCHTALASMAGFIWSDWQIGRPRTWIWTAIPVCLILYSRCEVNPGGLSLSCPERLICGCSSGSSIIMVMIIIYNLSQGTSYVQDTSRRTSSTTLNHSHFIGRLDVVSCIMHAG